MSCVYWKLIQEKGSLIISLMAKIHLIDDVINLSQGRPQQKIKNI